MTTIEIKGEKFALVPAQEYKDMKLELENKPASPYTYMTKTCAKSLVKRLLKNNNETCWLDNPDHEWGDWCCSSCCVYKILGDDAANRICNRDKRWSK